MAKDMAKEATGQYTPHEIEKYEAIYGRNFISPGGLETTRQFTATMTLAPEMHILDVGCGIGGPAFYMADRYHVSVHGLDLSATMLQIARKRLAKTHLKNQVTFEEGDILDFEHRQSYNRIHSRDAFLHIHQKERLFHVLFSCLKPGGRLYFTDYCCGEGGKSAEFVAYITQRQYALCTVAEYQALLGQAGFTDIMAQDRTVQFIDICEQELANLSPNRFDTQTLDSLRQSWQAKIERARKGEQRWGWFLAIKPGD